MREAAAPAAPETGPPQCRAPPCRPSALPRHHASPPYLPHAVSHRHSRRTLARPLSSLLHSLLPRSLLFRSVFNPDNVKALDTVLTYHVVSGAVTSSQLHDGQVIGTLDAGQSVTAHVQGQNVEINNARVLRANIMCTNGVIHIVDHVLVPGNFNYPKNDIPTTAESVSALSTLVTALKTGNIVRALSYPEGPFTVFAPNDAAFGKLPAGTLAYLLAHPQELDQVLAYHVVDARGDRGRGRLYADEIHNFQEAFTLEGQALVFVVAGGKVLVNGNSTVIQANVDCSNGVVHVVDTVLIPNQRALDAKVAAWNAKNLRNKLIGLGATPNLLQLAQSVPQLSTLVTAVTAAGIGSVLAGKGPLTVFAPNSEWHSRARARVRSRSRTRTF